MFIFFICIAFFGETSIYCFATVQREKEKCGAGKMGQEWAENERETSGSSFETTRAISGGVTSSGMSANKTQTLMSAY